MLGMNRSPECVCVCVCLGGGGGGVGRGEIEDLRYPLVITSLTKKQAKL